MSRKEIGSTIQIAQKLVDRFPEEIDRELKLLIQRAEEGQDTTTEIIDLLSPYEDVLSWLLEQIDLQNGQSGRTRGYGPLAGNPYSVPASRKWVCPKSNCTGSLPVIQEGEEPPICEKHKVEMVRGGRGERIISNVG